MWTRRQVLSLGIAGWALSQGLPRSALAAAPRREPRRPRYYLIVTPGGGMDSVYTTDPKTRTEVEDWVDVPYGANQIVNAGAYPLGPHFAPLARWAPRMAILNGVQVGTANHESGFLQASRLKMGVNLHTPSLLDLIGAHREGQPLASISLGQFVGQDYSAGWFGAFEREKEHKVPGQPPTYNPLLEGLSSQEPADLERMARVLRRRADELRQGGSAAQEVTAGNLEQVAALFDRIPSVPPLELRTWSDVPARQNLARHFQRILWAFENDLTCGAFLRMGVLEWDSHYANARSQTTWNGHFATMFDRFLEELHQRHNTFGPLADSTLVVVGSELGRFPGLNDNEGKDHLPQVPYLFLGAGVRTGDRGALYGATGRKMEGLPLSLATGRPTVTGGHLPTLDDVGTTLLHLAGLKPSLYGYNGRVLDFLLSA
jgi:uncharacterized protein (DUF1501 family)